MASIPRADASFETERLTEIKGVVPSVAALPPGCHFEPRCPEAIDICRAQAPAAGGGPARPPGGLLEGGPCLSCSRCATWSSTFRCGAGSWAGARPWCTPWTTSPSASGRTKPWGSWANRAAARPPPGSASCA
ncbi:MAG: hypothetical protein MZU95_02540 [Desulfomicrobium escambiense]|nr:hypothetical protein [Desulfomicrobium escambiense]